MNSNPQQDHVAPPTSELPACEPPPLAEVVVPHPCVRFGGLDNIPEDLLPQSEQVEDELNHAGMAQELPGEDRAHGP